MPSQDEKLAEKDELDDEVWASRTQNNESAEEQEGNLQVTVPWNHVGEACCES